MKNAAIVVLTLLWLALFSNAQANPPTSIVPGSREAAEELARMYLPLVLDAASPRVEIASSVMENDKGWVTAGVITKTGRKSCSVAMVKHAEANKTGWVVSALTCR